jgi:GMP synthase (glutamine-hydrolysing)
MPASPKVPRSIGDELKKLPPAFSVISHTLNAPIAAIANSNRKIYGTQFHPEFQANPLRPHPVFTAFIKAAITRSKGK